MNEPRIPLPPITRGTLTSKELAVQLGVSPSYVRSHVKELSARLETRPIEAKPGCWLWPIADLRARGVIEVAEPGQVAS